MKLSKIELELMTETNCTHNVETGSGSVIVEKDEKNDDYYKLLKEHSMLSQIRTSRWINFWSIVLIVCFFVSVLCTTIVVVYNKMEKRYGLQKTETYPNYYETETFQDKKFDYKVETLSDSYYEDELNKLKYNNF